MLCAGNILRSRYRIIRLLGQGGFGETYLAEDLDLPGNSKPKCVVKRLRLDNPNQEHLTLAKNLFNREAEVLYRLGHLHNQIPSLFAHFEENQEFYLVQEFIDGSDLTSEISPRSKLSEVQVVNLLREILEVLAVVHNQNIIHRDIKPANLMRRRDGKIVLIDFGIVKEIKNLTQNQGKASWTHSVGTKGYMPSEQALGEPRLCSDIYAVGMLGIYALTGTQPHLLDKDQTNGEVVWRHLASVSANTANVLTKMVRYHFTQRYQTVGEVLQALTPIISPPSVTPPPPPPIPKTTPILMPRRRLIQTAALTATGLGLAIIVPRIWATPKDNNPQGGQTNSPDNNPQDKPTSSVNEPQVEKTSSDKKPPVPFNLQTFKFETVNVDAQGNIINRRNLEAKQFVEDLGNGVTLEMVQIPGGTFLMGSPETEVGRTSDEGPQHQVSVKSFFMGKIEVTQEQYQVIMGSNPSKFKGEKLPVESVTWNKAVEFCERLSKITKRSYRLPSEAEWEYAARAGTTTPFYFGETIVSDLVNFNGNYEYRSAPKSQYREKTTIAGSLKANAFGLFDMHGNVWEWCQDDWHDNYLNAQNDGSAWLDLNSKNNTKLLRGGSWYEFPEYCRCADRYYSFPVIIVYYVGFRVVLVPA
jgi:eukaryotic-like serine/threonine-protein kinase